MSVGVDLATCDRMLRSLSPEVAVGEIGEIVEQYTDLDRIPYDSSPSISCEIAGATVQVLDATRHAGGSFKGVSMANYPQDVELPVIASAGNAALGLAAATAREGKEVVVFTPDSILPSKRDSLLAYPNVTLHAIAETFDHSVGLARAFARRTEGARAISGSGATAIAALMKTVAKDVVLAAQELQESSGNPDVSVAVQLGAGSLATACCLLVREGVENGTLRPGTSLVVATPIYEDRRFFDGLNVVRRGPHATAITGHPAYVQRRVSVGMRDVAEVRDVAATVLPEYLPYRFEPTGLAGMAAVLQDRQQRTSDNAAYVCVLSGTNGCQEINQELDKALSLARR